MHDRSEHADQPSIAILGGGISGLAAAHELHTQLPAANITTFEAADHCGGVIRTEQCDGFLIEQSADSFLVNEKMPWAGDLAAAIGMSDELISPNAENRRALIAHRDATPPVPEGFYLMAAGDLSATWNSPLLSRHAKWRLWAERFIRSGKQDVEESLEQFATRRVGRETYERLVQPLVSGIYSADPARLSVAAALPQFVEMEQQHGSLTAGLKKRGSQTRNTSGARYEMFRTPRSGLQRLIERLETTLAKNDVDVRRGQPVTEVKRTSNGWAVSTSDGEREFDGLISALPAPAAGRLLAGAIPELARELSSIEHVGIAVACLGYRRDQIQHPLDAFGLVVPAIEKRDSIAISFSSNKFPNRAPEDHVLLRVFLGGALRPDLIELDDDELLSRATNEAAGLLRINGNPMLSRLNRWQRITPQYYLGHLDRVAAIERHVSETTSFGLAGNALRGVGVPQCVRSGQTAAGKVVRDLK